MPVFLAEEFHDIAPPVDYSLIPPWIIFLGSFLALSLIGLTIWRLALRRKPPESPKSPRVRALEALARMREQTQNLHPYKFSIRVSDVLRLYVTEQYNLPVTRQTSVEFLEGLRKTSPFSEEDKILLEEFLKRCDLIKFARYDATSADSATLLEEATRFVEGGQLAVA